MEEGTNNMADPSHAVADLDDDAEELPVKERCIEQREALPGEPRCVNCGLYGEYICDETDDDICSIECKKVILSKIANNPKPNVNFLDQRRIPTNDECFYIRDDNGLGSQILTIREAESIRNKFDITVKGNNIPAPILSFSSCNLPQKLEQNLETAGYEIPTPVQMQTIPAAINNKNLLVSADTGSGKTASFLVPIVSHCVNIRKNNGADHKNPLAIILAPTRELCAQIEEEAKILGKGLPFKTALVIGGDAMATQVYRIQRGVELIIGTPGRLIDLLSKNEVELNDIFMFVLDEVDCMLQRGFQDQVMQIFQALSNPQLLMFSATISQWVEKMANSMVKDLIHVCVGKPSSASSSIKQAVIWVESKHKKKKLFDILASEKHFKPPTIVFVASRLGADLLSEAITTVTGLKALSVHGEKDMKERRENLKLFVMGEVPVIVSTGVLGRGVDLLKVKQVIVFDMPNSMEEYIHQIGRASRMREEGIAIVFVNEDDRKLFKELIQNLKSVGAAIPRELANSHYSLNTYQYSKQHKRRKFGS